MKKSYLLIIMLFSNIYALEHEVSGELKLFHYDIYQENKELSAYTTAIGGYLDYRALFGESLSANLRFYTSHPIDEGELRETTLLYQLDGNAINTLGIANISYEIYDTKFIIGAQRLFTPMANDDTTRIVPFTYSGITFKNTSFKNIKLYGGYIGAVKSLVEENFKEKTGSGELENGFYYLGLKAFMPLDIEFQSYGYYAYKLFDSFHNQLEYKPTYKAINFFAGLQSIYTSANSGAVNLLTQSDDVNIWAYKLGFSYNDFSFSNAYSKNSGEGNIVRGYGGYTKLYTSSMYETAKGGGGAEGLNFTAKYNFTPKLSIKSIYLKTTYDNPNANPYVSIYAGVKYYYMKESYIHFRYEQVDREKVGTDAKYIRFITTYTF